MNWLTSLLLVTVVSAGLAACGGGEEGASPGETPSPQVTPTPETTAESLPELADPSAPIVVSGQANIFAAGRSSDALTLLKAGGGEVPPGWALPPGPDRVVTFTRVAGGVSQLDGEPKRGPEGRHLGTTDVESYEGISGIVHRRNIMFVVGVFLADSPPSDPAPPRLDVTAPEKTDIIAPEIGQVFLVGDGMVYRYRVPPEATRLFLGFVDACHPTEFVGSPGCYLNNSGRIEATIELEHVAA